MKTAHQIIQEKAIKELISIESDRPVVDALIIMAEYRIGALIVLQKKKMVGIISERDYASKIVLKGKSSKDTLISDIMTRDVITLNAGDNFEKGLLINKQSNDASIPVVYGERLVG